MKLACSRPGNSRPWAEQAAQHIDHLKKGMMAKRAQQLLAGFGWPPEPLRTPGRAIALASATCEVELGSPVESSGESATTGYETALTDSERAAEDQPIATEPHAVAAE